MNEHRWLFLFAALSALGATSGIAIGIVQISIWLKRGELPVGALWLSAFLIGLFFLSAVSISFAFRRPTNPSIDPQLNRLNPYQLFAIHQLATMGQMTGDQFSQRMQEWGFPVANRAQETEIGRVFDEINRVTTLLVHEPSGAWMLRNREAILAQLRPT